MPRLIIATKNPHKVEEISAILGEGIECVSLQGFTGVPEIREDAATFAGNARKKALEMAVWLTNASATNLQVRDTLSNQSSTGVVADDSGLEVDALGGAPGIHSARFASEEGQPAKNTPDAENNAKLLRLLEGIPPRMRTARFRCVIAYTRLSWKPEPASPATNMSTVESHVTYLFDGACEGMILESPRGEGGFGYDPLFVPSGFDVTYAELGEETKNKISHRARALEKLKAFLLHP